MAYNLFALTSMPGGGIFRIVTSQDIQEEITSMFDVQEEELLRSRYVEFPFDVKYSPDEAELSVIKDFPPAAGYYAAIRNPMSYQELQLTPATMDAIKALFCGTTENGGKILFQAFDRRRVISNRGYSLIHNGNTFRKFEGNGITLDNKITAAIYGNDLKFASFTMAHRIFSLADYFAAATDADIDRFCAHAAFASNAAADFKTLADDWMRRRVVAIQQSGALDQLAPHALAEMATQFSVDVAVVGIRGEEKMALPADKRQLKNLLHFLAEDFYISPITETKFLSNSKRPVH